MSKANTDMNESEQYGNRRGNGYEGSTKSTPPERSEDRMDLSRAKEIMARTRGTLPSGFFSREDNNKHFEAKGFLAGHSSRDAEAHKVLSQHSEPKNRHMNRVIIVIAIALLVLSIWISIYTWGELSVLSSGHRG